MNLIEAIKSGKPFKRKGEGDDYWRTFGVKPERSVYLDGNLVQFLKDDLLAQDWIIQEEKIELTAEQIRKALMRAEAYGAETVEYVIKELGFKE